MLEKPINLYLDHAVLKPEMTRKEAITAIRLGLDYEVRSVCVRPCDIAVALELCRDTTTGVSCVLAFPHGDALSSIKAAEAREYAAMGVEEIDMVANYGWIRSALWAEVEADIRAVVDAARPHGTAVKVILETSQLMPDEIVGATRAAIAAGAAFVKTSTGFHGEGATEAAVRLMAETAAGRIQVKASGGIRDRAAAEKFIALGASRIGIGYATTPIICDSAASGAVEGDY